MKTKLILRFLTIAILMTLVLLSVCLISIFFNPTLDHDVYIMICNIFITLLFAFLIEVFWWTWLDNKETDKLFQKFQNECDKLEYNLKLIMLRNKMWQLYFDSLNSELISREEEEDKCY